jgi:phospholipase C
VTEGLSRRRLLQLGAGAAGGVAASSLLPPSVQAALAAPAPQGGIENLRHVVFLMQENRSFDHYFGALRGVRGFDDRNAVVLRDGHPVFSQPAAGGAKRVLPFGIREAAQASKKDVNYIAMLDHSWHGGYTALANGWHDGWVTSKGAATMAHYDRTDLAFHYELADTFTICDAYHCSVPSSTGPNRNFFVSGYTGYEPPPNQHKRSIENDQYNEDTHGGYSWPTYAERLEQAGKSWRVYQEWDNYQDNNLEFFVPFKRVARKALAGLGLRSMDTFYNQLRAASPGRRTELLAALAEGVAGLSRAERRLYDRGLRRVEAGGLGHAFRADALAGKLPQVSYVVASAADSEHPAESSPAASATLLYQVLDALAANPETWRSTALFVTYDENDGYFDHMPPPRPPASETDEFYDGKPIGLGPRVPMLVISPWTVGGYVCSEVFDHTSMTRFVERWLDVPSAEISRWRRTVSGDLHSAFDFRRRRPQPAVDQPGQVPAFNGRWTPVPPAEQQMPRQEPGRRRARPLPYQPEAHASLDGDTLRLTLSSSGMSSAHLVVYPYAGEFVAPQHFDVRDEEVLSIPRSAAYRLTVIGPNGFRRELAGQKGEAAEVASIPSARGRAVRLTLRNNGTTPLTFEVSANAYGPADAQRVVVPAGNQRFVRWETQAHEGWYDVTIRVAEDTSFHRRLAGHLENGRESVSG